MHVSGTALVAGVSVIQAGCVQRQRNTPVPLTNMVRCAPLHAPYSLNYRNEQI